MLTTVRQLIGRKGSTIWSTQPDAIVFEAFKLMAEKEIGALLVFEESQVLPPKVVVLDLDSSILENRDIGSSND